MEGSARHHSEAVVMYVCLLINVFIEVIRLSLHLMKLVIKIHLVITGAATEPTLRDNESLRQKSLLPLVPEIL